MSAITAFILILTFTMVYAIFVELFTILFRITGLTKVKAKFQAISLLTNCGYTTNESEIVMNHKLRRKLAMISMITGYIYSVIIVSLFINLLNNISSAYIENNYKFFIISIAVFIVLFIVIKLPFIRKINEKIIEKLAKILLKTNEKDNVITLLDIYGKDAIVEVLINSIPESMKDKQLFEINFRETYKMNVLLLKRKGKVLEITRNTMFQNGDIIFVFGTYQNIIDLFGKSGQEKNLDAKIQNQNIVELIDNYGRDAMMEIKINQVPKQLENISLLKSGLRENEMINILMIKRNKATIMVTKDTEIKKNDIIIAFGPYENIRKIFTIS